MRITIQKPDNIGAIASVLCMIHCAITPFIFVAQTCSMACCASAPSWWKWIDYFFLIISFLAVYHSVKTTSKQWMKTALWVSWISLFLVILNERLIIVQLPELITYIVAGSMVLLHLYNRKYCQCKHNTCCASTMN